MAANPFGTTLLPPTVTARRNARLRAAALAAIPLILFVIAAFPRVWAPDLVPFGPLEARYVAQAEQQVPVSLGAAYLHSNVSALAIFESVVGVRPVPIIPWIVFRGLVDAGGVVCLYFAARQLSGPLGGTLAALLYAASPFAWAFARDVTGAAGPVLTSAALLAAVRLIERPTIVRGAILGITLGLLARSLPFGACVVLIGVVALGSGPASWRVIGVMLLALLLSAGGGLLWWTGYDVPDRPRLLVQITALQPIVPLLLAIALGTSIREIRWVLRVGVGGLAVVGAAMIAWTMQADAQTEWQHPAFINRAPGMHGEGYRRPEAGGSLKYSASYREAGALASAIQEAAGRAGVNEVILVPGYLPEWWLTPFPYDVLLDGARTVEFAGNVVLPLEREMVFLVASEGQMPGFPERPIEIQRPSSSIRVLTSQGADTGVELLTLRPRSAADWLARTHTVSNGEFVDGTRLLGYDAQYGEYRYQDVPVVQRYVDVSLYWELHPSVGGRSDPVAVVLGFAETPADQRQGRRFPAVDLRRKEYLLLTQVRVSVPADPTEPGPLRLTVLDDQRQPVRTTGGDDALTLPLPANARQAASTAP